jgi:hypothetical protein
MFTGFIKCDCNGVCIEVNPFICTTSTSTSTSTSTTTTSTSTSSTTTTTTTGCAGYFYNVTTYDCGTCVFNGNQGLINNVPLTIGKYYYDGTSDKIVRIDVYNGCSGRAISSILDANGKVTCSEISC